ARRSVVRAHPPLLGSFDAARRQPLNPEASGRTHSAHGASCAVCNIWDPRRRGARRRPRTRRQALMERLERYAPLSGVLAVVLWVAGVVVMDSDMPGDKAPGAEIAAWFDSKSGAILLAVTFFGIGSAAFMWFLGTLAARLRGARGDGRLPGIMFVAGAASIALVTMGPGSYAAGAMAYGSLDRTLEPGAAEVLFVLGQGFFVVAEFVAVAFMGAACLALAVMLIFSPIGWAALYLGIPLWTLVTGIWLYLRGSSARGAAEAVAP